MKYFKYLDTTYPTDNKRRYHDFDISDKQFPKDSSHDTIQLSLHNCLEPFPAERHGKYDLVHVRLMVAALKESDYKHVVANIAEQEGHLQWEDLGRSYFLTNPEKHYQELPSMNTLRLCIEGQINAGPSRDVPATVVEAAKSAGFTNISKYDFRIRDKPELWFKTEEWIDRVLESLTRIFLKRKRDAAGKDSD
ncbi:conserved hypothetical protein [Talaromyces stipitatus ATCC 10500]|uniref:Uncharacterized protein n=1 Tax=Talaromyces stipitatus (strain ATCC 10500 / CBS 375.48 / QM 6759 / NRRL 1006) TaxID=441959 RepID=B8LV50_TALSN|nr:uncharacterized protein TSTA_065550 [Talaromyces stipitatus ATCC 10500]EED23100.1 conserved hypothetical protein [Talaromyces stipitatus ATCC 10500]